MTVFVFVFLGNTARRISRWVRSLLHPACHWEMQDLEFWWNIVQPERTNLKILLDMETKSRYIVILRDYDIAFESGLYRHDDYQLPANGCGE